MWTEIPVPDSHHDRKCTCNTPPLPKGVEVLKAWSNRDSMTPKSSDYFLVVYGGNDWFACECTEAARPEYRASRYDVLNADSRYRAASLPECSEPGMRRRRRDKYTPVKAMNWSIKTSKRQQLRQQRLPESGSATIGSSRGSWNFRLPVTSSILYDVLK